MNPGLDEEKIFVLRGGAQPWAGPYSRSEFDGFFGGGALADGDLVWSTKRGSWLPARQFLEADSSPPVPEVQPAAPSVGSVIRKMIIGTAAIAFSFWGLCWLSAPPPEVEVDPVVRFDLDDDFDIPLNAIDAGLIDNTVEPRSTPDASPSPGEDWTENSG